MLRTNELHLDQRKIWRTDTQTGKARAAAIRRFIRSHQCNPLHSLALEQLAAFEDFTPYTTKLTG